MKTVTERTNELNQLSMDELLALRLTTTRPSAKGMVRLQAMDKDTLIDDILNYELGACLVDWD